VNGHYLPILFKRYKLVLKVQITKSQYDKTRQGTSRINLFCQIKAQKDDQNDLLNVRHTSIGERKTAMMIALEKTFLATITLIAALYNATHVQRSTMEEVFKKNGSFVGMTAKSQKRRILPYGRMAKSCFKWCGICRRAT